MSSGQYRVLQVSNISPTANKDQVHALFSYIGRIEELKVYPTETTSQTQAKFAYVKFDKEKAVEVGQHLTNTVFIDRALVCVPAPSNFIPDEETALQSGGPLMPGQRQLPPNVVNTEQDIGDGQKMLVTTDPTLTALGLPPYPALPAVTEPSKVEEIRRTVYVGNLEKNCDGDELMNFLNTNIGEVMYLRMTTGSDSLTCAYAYVEFSNQNSVPLALQNNGIEYKGRCLRIQHSRVAIIKPQRKTADQALAEVEEAIKTNEGKDKIEGITRGFSPLNSGSSPSRRRRSPSLRRRSRDRRERSHSPRYSKSPTTRRGSRRSRTRSPRGRDKRSKSRERKSKRSRSKDKDRKSSKKRSSRDREKAKDKEGERERYSRSGKDKEKESKSKKERKRSRSKTPKKDRKERDKDREHKKSSPKRKKETNGSSNTSPVTKTSKSMVQEMEFEEETLRERLLERVKRKSNGSEKENGSSRV